MSTEDENNSNTKWIKRQDRTVHAAIDRLLSTLLVEIDGISIDSKTWHDGVLSPSLNKEKDRVIVIATATNIDALDRYCLD